MTGSGGRREMVQTDHFEITVLATSRTIDVRKLSL
jgi:hypothetical protein